MDWARARSYRRLVNWGRMTSLGVGTTHARSLSKVNAMTPIDVLLIDDHPMIRVGIRRLLELETRIKVVGEVGSAEEAMELIDARSAEAHDAQPVDVVLMDVKLPGIDGIDATRLLSDKYPEVKVVILSSFGSEFLAQAIEAGAIGYILKTASQQELVHAVVLASNGLSPIDPSLTAGLLDQFAMISKIARHRGLSSRQHQILQLVAEGTPSKEIAARLAISYATFNRDIRSIFNHLCVNDRAQAVAEAYRRRLL